MLYVGCGNCRTIVPLWCAGQFPPHAPLPVMAGPYGAYCGMCGPMSPVFTCTICWTRQMLFLPGSALRHSSMYPGSNRGIAPAVQAQPGASWSSILKLIGQAVGDYAEQTGGELPTMDFDQWTQGWDQSGPQGGDPSW
jgi:hypothetical protein